MKKLVLILVGMIVVLGLIGLVLPDEYRVERSAVIGAEPGAVHAEVLNLETWPEWSAWTRKRDPDCEWTFEGVAGTGSVMTWKGPELGEGQLKITANDPPKSLLYDLAFDGGKYLSRGGLTFEQQADGGTKITWFNEGKLGADPISKYMGLMMDSVLGKEFEQGLEGLKSRLERR